MERKPESTNMTKQQLIEDNLGLVYHVVKTRFPTYFTDEDVVSAGMLGLCKAADRYDSEKGAFVSFACTCILTEVRNEFRRRSKHNGVLSLEYETDGENGSTCEFGDCIVGEEDVGYVDVEGRLSRLKPKEREMLELYATGLTYREIASKMGVSRQTVCTAIRRAKLLWRNYDEQ